MNLEDLVPCYILCDKIPLGEFNRSVFVWTKGGKHVTTRKPNMELLAPAPTLMEIITALSVPMAHHVFWTYSQVEPGKKYPFGGIVSFALETWFMQEEEKENELP